jgi:hypothetical protein
MKKTILALSIFISLGNPLFSQQTQFAAPPNPWSTNPTGVSFTELNFQTPDKSFNLEGNWYYNDSESGILTLEKPYSSTQGGAPERNIIAQIMGSQVDFIIQPIGNDEPTGLFRYTGSKLSDLQFQGYFEFGMGPSGYGDWIPVPLTNSPPSILNLGKDMLGQSYILNYLPSADFSYPEDINNTSAYFEEAQALNIDLEFTGGTWVPKN